MATTVQSTTRAFACPLKYIQGPGEFDRLESYTNAFGSQVLFVIDGFLYEDLKARLADAGHAKCRQVIRPGGTLRIIPKKET